MNGDRGERPSFLDQLQGILNPNVKRQTEVRGVPERTGRGMEWAGYSERGRREEQQDFFRISPLLINGERYDLAAIFDGHGGTRVAAEAAARLHEYIGNYLRGGSDPAEALEKAFMYFGQLMGSHREGSTAIVSLVAGNKLYLAHIGDSRAVLVRGGESYLLNHLHNPEMPEEYRRVIRVGGIVRQIGNTLRIGAKGLAVTRAFGDAGVTGVSSVPDMYECDLVPGDVLMLMCDGVWKKFDLAFLKVAEQMNPVELAKKMVNWAYARGSSDNLTTIVGKVS